MDPAVTAAVIAVPTALFAAAAAYAGARAQARSAHRGPVDAVRRQHQRDAYAAFLAALHAYQAATDWDTCYERIDAEMHAAGVQPSPGAAQTVAQRTLTLISTASVDELMRTGAAVDLEGPEHIAACATITLGAAREIRMEARWPFSSWDSNEAVVAAHERLGVAISGFVQAARAHLNDFRG
ncbi:hypothetical protein ACIQTN_29600 [Streptomyces werraensis]|uniref:hypothetical protein n=1 Tax=Streptomyces werraensis TaxID=68284 RepID=UPI0038246F1C